MSYIKRKAYGTVTEYSTVYNNMRGVDFSGDGSNISRNRFAYLENMYRDYEGDGAGVVESIPGFRKIHRFPGKVNGLFASNDTSGNEYVTAHISDRLYRIAVKDIDTLGEVGSICTVADSESHAISIGDSLYLFDGADIIKIKDQYAEKISDGGGVYVPTTYVNGTEYEQRNLLTRCFKERYIIGSTETYAYASPTLTFAVTDDEKKTCKVTGINDSQQTTVYIPSRTKIGDSYFSVTEIDDTAFMNNTAIKECYIASGIRRIGNIAFGYCTSLETVVLPDTVSVIGNSAFTQCRALRAMHLGRGLTTLGNAVFAFCSSLTEITYSGTSEEFMTIENTEILGNRTVTYETVIKSGAVGISIFSPCIQITAASADGKPLAFEAIYENFLVREVKISLDNKSMLDGREITVEGILSSTPSDYRGIHSGFLSSCFIGGKEVSKVITGCRISEIFDGKLFLSGNPDYPGYCFYSATDESGENNPLYFGDLNYFRDGIGGANNISMLACGDSLAVFKEADDGGTIFYHSPHETGIDIIPKIYPVNYIHSGVAAVGESISFFDDPIFITPNGVSALDKRKINLERSVVTRSHNVNPKLLSENLKKAKLAVWRGYLAVAVGGNIYLADSRMTFTHETGNFEYEWYFLSGIGTYESDSRVYRYASLERNGFSLWDKTDTRAVGTVFNGVFSGESVSYVINDGKYYEVYPTEEYEGGTFSPLKNLCVLGERLFFITENGTLCVFNNDKRGCLPPEVRNQYSVNEEIAEIEALVGRRIHPYYYSFDRHAPRYAIVTAKDNCGIPHLEKNTVKHSLTLKCRAVAGSSVFCEAGTDSEGYSELCRFPSSDMFFADFSFSSFTFLTDDIYTVPVAEKAKGWIEKQIIIYTNEYNAPFGLYSIAYRFKVKGKIKKGR